MTEKQKLLAMEDLLGEDLRDPERQAAWERTALARAMAVALVRYRAQHGLTQTGLARRLGIPQPHVARLEAGEHNPSWETLQRISSRLGIPIAVVIVPPGTHPPLPSDRRASTAVQEFTTAEGGRVVVAVG